MIRTYVQIDMRVGVPEWGGQGLNSLFLWEYRLNDLLCLRAAVKIKEIESSCGYLAEEEHSPR